LLLKFRDHDSFIILYVSDGIISIVGVFLLPRMHTGARAGTWIYYISGFGTILYSAGSLSQHV